MQGGAQYAARACDVATLRASCIDLKKTAPVHGTHIDSVAHIACGRHRLVHAKATHRAQGRACDCDSGAIDTPLRITLNEFDIQAEFAQRYAGRHSGNPAADNEDRQFLSHRCAPPLKLFRRSIRGLCQCTSR